MMAAMDVPCTSRNIPSTISFFDALAPDNFADDGVVLDPNAGALEATTPCFTDEDRVVRDGLGFANFDCRFLVAI
jgi:hypothetical protein